MTGPRLRDRLRRGWIALASAGFLVVLLGSADDAPAPRLILNLSDSVARGLYWRLDAQEVGHGALVAARLPAPWSDFADVRGYLPRAAVLLKYAAALPGDHLCVIAPDRLRVTTPVAVMEISRRRRDGSGRELSAWSGCRDLLPDEVLLLTPAVDDAFDGRYFGPLHRQHLLGPVVTLRRFS